MGRRHRTSKPNPVTCFLHQLSPNITPTAHTPFKDLSPQEHLPFKSSPVRKSYHGLMGPWVSLAITAHVQAKNQHMVPAVERECMAAQCDKFTPICMEAPPREKEVPWKGATTGRPTRERLAIGTHRENRVPVTAQHQGTAWKICLYKPSQHFSGPLLCPSPLSSFAHCQGHSATWVWAVLHSELLGEGILTRLTALPLHCFQTQAHIGH